MEDGREVYKWATACPADLKTPAESLISGKIHNVPDETCAGCPQNWRGECRAFCIPHSTEERRHRMDRRGISYGLACLQKDVSQQPEAGKPYGTGASGQLAGGGSTMADVDIRVKQITYDNATGEVLHTKEVTEATGFEQDYPGLVAAMKKGHRITIKWDAEDRIFLIDVHPRTGKAGRYIWGFTGQGKDIDRALAHSDFTACATVVPEVRRPGKMSCQRT